MGLLSRRLENVTNPMIRKAVPGPMTGKSAPAVAGAVEIVPANRASFEDLQAILGPRGAAARCQCQHFRMTPAEWSASRRDERAARFREQTACGQPRARSTSGLVAYAGGEPAGWCAVGPRPVYVHLRGSRVVWAGRAEDRDDDSVWAVTCFVTRAGFRWRGISASLAAAAVDFARDRGARAIEGYPMITRPGQQITWGELYVGSRSVFADAGFAEVTHPTPRRCVMRIDY
jgi:GNAT superfamily N-acetyltransferase